MSERLREALGYNNPPPPPPETVPLPSTEELLVRVEALNATTLLEPDLTGVDTLTGAAMVLGTDTITDTAEAVLAMGKAAPLPLIFDARDALETKEDVWNAKLHPRDGNGRFINVGAILNLLGSVGGGRGTVIGNGPNNTVTIRREDGTTLDVPGDQTYADGDGAPVFGEVGTPDTFSKKPGTFARVRAAANDQLFDGRDAPDLYEGSMLQDVVDRGLDKIRGGGKEKDKPEPDVHAPGANVSFVYKGKTYNDGKVVKRRDDGRYTIDWHGQTVAIPPEDVTANTPDAKAPAAERITPPNLPNDRNELFRALNSNKPTGGKPDAMALHAAANAIGATGKGHDSGVELANHSNDRATNERISGMMDSLIKIADELDADNNTVTTDGGDKLSDYLRFYANGFNEQHQARVAADGGEPDKPSLGGRVRTAAENLTHPSAENPQGSPERDDIYDTLRAKQREEVDQLSPDQRSRYYAALLDPQGVPSHGAGQDNGHATAIAAATETHVSGDTAKALMDHLAEGGFTFKPGEGFVTTGYAVAVPGKGQEFKSGELTPEAIDNYIDEHWDELSANPALHIGGWLGDDGTSWLDLTEVHASYADAYIAGQSRGELAIGHLDQYAKGEDGTIPIAYDKRPVSGPAADKWDDPNGGVTKILEGNRPHDVGQESGTGSAAAGRDQGSVQGAHEGSPLGGPEPGVSEDIAPPPDPGQAFLDALSAATLPSYVPLKTVARDIREAFGDINREGKPEGTGDSPNDPIDVGGDVDKAVQLLAAGKHVRLNQPDEVATLLDKLAALASEAKAKGEKAPVWDLCRVSVPGTNLFCSENQGVDRINMPQLEGTPVPGSAAASLPVQADGNVNLGPAFIASLKAMGIETTDKTIPASHLRASQRELDGAKVAGIMKAMQDPNNPNHDALDAPIFVTRDGYVIDGHHRWAAKVGLDVEDGHLGDVDMKVRQIDLDIGAALDYANAFTANMGVESQGVDARMGEAGTTNANAPRDPKELAVHESIVRVGIVQQRYLDSHKDTESLYDKIDGKQGKYTAEREKQQDGVIAHFLDAPGVKSEGKAVILGGLPGAGKTTFIDSPEGQKRLGINKADYVIVNPDDVKEVMQQQGMIPNYEGLSPNEQATLFHEEASSISKRLMQQAMADNKNVLFDTTLKDEGQLDRMVDYAKKSGHDYDTTAVFVDVPIAKAKERALARYEAGGRFVPIGVIDRQAAPPDSGYNSLNAMAFDRSKDKVNHWLHVDASVDDAPRVVGDSETQHTEDVNAIRDKYGLDLAAANEVIQLRQQLKNTSDDALWQELEDRLVSLLVPGGKP